MTLKEYPRVTEINHSFPQRPSGAGRGRGGSRDALARLRGGMAPPRKKRRSRGRWGGRPGGGESVRRGTSEGTPGFSGGDRLRGGFRREGARGMRATRI